MFPNLEAFIARQPLLYAQNFGLNGYTAHEAALLESFWQHEAAVYVQDRFRPTPRLTIGMGLRYDMQINPQPQAGIAGVQVPVGMPVVAGNQVQLTYAPVPQGIPHDRNNWGPRTDVAYQLPGDGLTMVKGSAGLYYGRTPMIYFPLRGAGVSNTTLFAPASRFGVTFPEVLPSAIAPGSALATLVGPPAISYVDPEFGNPRVLQLTASLTRRVAGMSLEAGYIRSESRNLRVGGFRSTSWDRNLAPPTRFDRVRPWGRHPRGRPPGPHHRSGERARQLRSGPLSGSPGLAQQADGEPVAVLRELHAREEHGQRLDRA